MSGAHSGISVLNEITPLKISCLELCAIERKRCTVSALRLQLGSWSLVADTFVVAAFVVAVTTSERALLLAS